MTFVEDQKAEKRAAIEPFLFLYITEQCQLRCAHCYMGDRLEHERRMTPEFVEEVLRFLKISYGHYKVYLLGGEPTTHPELSRIVDTCISHGYEVVLTSNGLIPEKVWKVLQPSKIASLSFSADGGSAATHEFMRGANTYAPLWRSIRRSIETGFNTRLIYTVTRANVAEIPEFIELAESIGVAMLSFHYFTPTGRGRSHEDFQLRPEEWLRFTRSLRDEATRRVLQIFYPPAFADAMELEALVSKGYRGCTARNLERLAIFPDGRVYICSAFFDTNAHYAEFRDGCIRPRAGNDNELSYVNVIASNCSGCSLSSSCKGGCAAYDYFGRTKVSSDCDRTVAPICPLWSTAAADYGSHASIGELR